MTLLYFELIVSEKAFTLAESALKSAVCICSLAMTMPWPFVGQDRNTSPATSRRINVENLCVMDYFRMYFFRESGITWLPLVAKLFFAL